MASGILKTAGVSFLIVIIAVLSKCDLDILETLKLDKNNSATTNDFIRSLLKAKKDLIWIQEANNFMEEIKNRKKKSEGNRKVEADKPDGRIIRLDRRTNPDYDEYYGYDRKKRQLKRKSSVKIIDNGRSGVLREEDYNKYKEKKADYPDIRYLKSQKIQIVRKNKKDGIEKNVVEENDGEVTNKIDNDFHETNYDDLITCDDRKGHNKSRRACKKKLSGGVLGADEKIFGATNIKSDENKKKKIRSLINRIKAIKRWKREILMGGGKATIEGENDRDERDVNGDKEKNQFDVKNFDLKNSPQNKQKEIKSDYNNREHVDNIKSSIYKKEINKNTNKKNGNTNTDNKNTNTNKLATKTDKSDNKNMDLNKNKDNDNKIIKHRKCDVCESNKKHKNKDSEHDTNTKTKKFLPYHKSKLMDNQNIIDDYANRPHIDSPDKNNLKIYKLKSFDKDNDKFTTEQSENSATSKRHIAINQPNKKSIKMPSFLSNLFSKKKNKNQNGDDYKMLDAQTDELTMISNHKEDTPSKSDSKTASTSKYKQQNLLKSNSVEKPQKNQEKLINDFLEQPKYSNDFGNPMNSPEGHRNEPGKFQNLPGNLHMLQGNLNDIKGNLQNIKGHLENLQGSFYSKKLNYQNVKAPEKYTQVMSPHRIFYKLFPHSRKQPQNNPIVQEVSNSRGFPQNTYGTFHIMLENEDPHGKLQNSEEIIKSSLGEHRILPEIQNLGRDPYNSGLIQSLAFNPNSHKLRYQTIQGSSQIPHLTWKDKAWKKISSVQKKIKHPTKISNVPQNAMRLDKYPTFSDPKLHDGTSLIQVPQENVILIPLVVKNHNKHLNKHPRPINYEPIQSSENQAKQLMDVDSEFHERNEPENYFDFKFNPQSPYKEQNVNFPFYDFALNTLSSEEYYDNSPDYQNFLKSQQDGTRIFIRKPSEKDLKKEAELESSVKEEDFRFSRRSLKSFDYEDENIEKDTKKPSSTPKNTYRSRRLKVFKENIENKTHKRRITHKTVSKKKTKRSRDKRKYNDKNKLKSNKNLRVKHNVSDENLVVPRMDYIIDTKNMSENLKVSSNETDKKIETVTPVLVKTITQNPGFGRNQGVTTRSLGSTVLKSRKKRELNHIYYDDIDNAIKSKFIKELDYENGEGGSYEWNYGVDRRDLKNYFKLNNEFDYRDEVLATSEKQESAPKIFVIGTIKKMEDENRMRNERRRKNPKRRKDMVSNRYQKSKRHYYPLHKRNTTEKFVRADEDKTFFKNNRNNKKCDNINGTIDFECDNSRFKIKKPTTKKTTTKKTTKYKTKSTKRTTIRTPFTDIVDTTEKTTSTTCSGKHGNIFPYQEESTKRVENIPLAKIPAVLILSADKNKKTKCKSKCKSKDTPIRLLSKIGHKNIKNNVLETNKQKTDSLETNSKRIEAMEDNSQKIDTTDTNSGKVNTPETNSGNIDTIETNSDTPEVNLGKIDAEADTNSGQMESPEVNPGQVESPEVNPGQVEALETNSGNSESDSVQMKSPETSGGRIQLKKMQAAMNEDKLDTPDAMNAPNLDTSNMNEPNVNTGAANVIESNLNTAKSSNIVTSEMSSSVGSNAPAELVDLITTMNLSPTMASLLVSSTAPLKTSVTPKPSMKCKLSWENVKKHSKIKNPTNKLIDVKEEFADEENTVAKQNGREDVDVLNEQNQPCGIKIVNTCQNLGRNKTSRSKLLQLPNRVPKRKHHRFNPRNMFNRRRFNYPTLIRRPRIKNYKQIHYRPYHFYNRITKRKYPYVYKNYGAIRLKRSNKLIPRRRRKYRSNFYGFVTNKKSRGNERRLRANSPKSDQVRSESELEEAKGILPVNIIENVYRQVQERQNLKQIIGPVLRRKPASVMQMRAIEKFKDNQNEIKVRRTEEMLNLIMKEINNIVYEQISSQTCQRLQPKLQDYLTWLTDMSRTPTSSEVDGDVHGLELDGVNGTYLTTQNDPKFLFDANNNRIDMKVLKREKGVVRSLIGKYNRLKGNDKVKYRDIKLYLENYLDILKLLEVDINNRMEKASVDRQKSAKRQVGYRMSKQYKKLSDRVKYFKSLYDREKERKFDEEKNRRKQYKPYINIV